MFLRHHRSGRHALGVAAVALFAVTAAGCGGGGKKAPPAQVVQQQPTPSASETAPRRVRPLARSVPSRLRIPKLHVNSPIMRLGLNADHTIQVPPLSRPNMTGWWDGGPTPGEKGASVILGHNIGNGRPSVFEKLGSLKPGDRVEVTRGNGSVATFEVTKLEEIPRAASRPRGLRQAVLSGHPADHLRRPVRRVLGTPRRQHHRLRQVGERQLSERLGRHRRRDGGDRTPLAEVTIPDLRMPALPPPTLNVPMLPAPRVPAIDVTVPDLGTYNGHGWDPPYPMRCRARDGGAAARTRSRRRGSSRCSARA